MMLKQWIEIQRKEGRLGEVKGKKCWVYEVGSCRFYGHRWNEKKQKWQGLWSEWGKVKKRDVSNKKSRFYKSHFDIWKTTKYDQIEGWTERPEDYRKYRRICIEDFDDVISAYRANGWTDPVEFVAAAILADVTVDVSFHDKNQATYTDIIREVRDAIGRQLEGEKTPDESDDLAY